MKKFLALFLTVMLLSSFGLVAAAEQTTTLSITTMGEGDAKDFWIWKWLEHKLDLKLEVTHVGMQQVAEIKPIMLASGDLPDILIGFSFGTGDLVTYGVMDEVLLNLGDYVNAQSMPNLWAWIEERPEVLGSITTSDGCIYTLPAFQGHTQMVGQMPRLFVNTNWMAQAGIDEYPKTLEAFTEMLYAFKALYPESIPLGGSSEGMDPRHYVLNALGFLVKKDSLGTSACVRNGEAVIPAYDDVYLQYLTVLREYYENGLISPDFFTIDTNTMRAQMQEGKIGVVPEPAYLSLPAYEDFKNWEAVYPLTSEYNETMQWSSATTFTIGGVVVSQKAKDKIDAIVKFLDYWYTDEAFVYLLNGPMKDSEDTLGLTGGWYIGEDGNITYDEVVNGTYSSEYNCRLGIISPYASQPFGSTSNLIGRSENMTKVNAMLEMAGIEVADEIVYNLNEGDANYRASAESNLYPYTVYGFPFYAYYTEDITIRLGELTSVITPYVKQETARFITGIRSLDEFGAYQDELRALGVEELLEYYQDAYSQYLSGLKQ